VLAAGTKDNGRGDGGGEQKHEGRGEGGEGGSQVMVTADIGITDGDTQEQAHVHSIASLGPIEEQPVGETAGSRARSSASACDGASDPPTADVDSSSVPSAALHGELEIPAVVPSVASSSAASKPTGVGGAPAQTGRVEYGSAPPGAGTEPLEGASKRKSGKKRGKEVDPEKVAERKLKADNKAKQKAEKKAKKKALVEVNVFTQAGMASTERMEEGKGVGPCHDVMVAEDVETHGDSKNEVCEVGGWVSSLGVSIVILVISSIHCRRRCCISVA